MAMPLVQVMGVSKSFGSTAALSRVSINGTAGSIHAVTGENGAGKSTLMKLLAGVHAPDDGQICIAGLRVQLASPAHARRAGVSTVFQELTVLPNLSVEENLNLGREPLRGRMLDRRGMRQRAQAVLQKVGLQLDARRPCGELSVGEQQMLEIAKGLAADARVFIFDEPTAPLNRAEVDRLEALLRALQREGKLVFYISHRLEEIFRFCDTVSVLKDGQHVATQPIGALDPDRLVRLMVGRELKSLFPTRAAQAPGTLRLSAEGLKIGHAPPLKLQLRAGEIVGIAGLEGQGQRAIMRALATLPSAALMPEDRKAEGLYLSLNIQDNIWLGKLHGARLWQRARRNPGLVTDLAERLRLRAKPTTAVGSLSGGNQQKVMLGRWLASGVKTLLVEQPTRGVDVGAKAEIYALLRQYTNEGGAVLAVSGDLLELLGLCDRILVVRAGAIVADVPAAHATEESLLALALQDADVQKERP